MRIAVIGSGIAGLGTAWLLSHTHEVVLFEAEGRLGGHTHTHDVEHAGRNYRVDSGFIVFNPANYPHLTRLFSPWAWHRVDQDYFRCATTQRGNTTPGIWPPVLQKRNLVSAFWGMLIACGASPRPPARLD